MNTNLIEMTTLWLSEGKLTAAQGFVPIGTAGILYGARGLESDITVLMYYRVHHGEDLGDDAVLVDVPAEVLADLRRRYHHPDHALAATDQGPVVDPLGFMPAEFTIAQLRKVYEAIYNRPILKDTFRRRVVGGLVGTGEYADDFGRPAELHRRYGASA